MSVVENHRTRRRGDAGKTGGRYEISAKCMERCAERPNIRKQGGRAVRRVQGTGRNDSKYVRLSKLVLNCRLPFLLLLPLLLLSFGCSKTDGQLKAGFESGQYRTVVAFGDSIVEGYQQPEGWPEILGRNLAGRYPGVRIINAGVSGDTAGDGLRRLQKDVLGHQPDLVLVAFGLNDMKNGVQLSQFQEDITALVLEISAAGAQPVLLTTTRLQQGASMLARLNPAPFNESIHTLAKERSIPLIDVNDEFKGMNTAKYLMDAAHPNMEGYRRLAEIIRNGLIGE